MCGRYGKAKTVGVRMKIREGRMLEPTRLEIGGSVTIPFTKEAVTRLLEVPIGGSRLTGMDTINQDRMSFNPLI